MDLHIKFMELRMPAPAAPGATMIGVVISKDHKGRPIVIGPYLGRAKDEIRRVAEAELQGILPS